MSRILVIDDNVNLANAVVLLLEKQGHEGVAVPSGRAGLEVMRHQEFDLVITDYRMDDMNGLEVLRAIKQEFPDTDVMLLTGYGTIEIAVEAMKEGAFDFIEKENLNSVLPAKVAKVLEYRSTRHESQRLNEENQYLRGEIGERFNNYEIIGNSEPMRMVLNTVEKVAATDSSVLIYGESGTGKELVARAVHAHSSRSDKPFVKVNCGALPSELVESELFGHEKGAFTGAVRPKKGKFELAETGTIFLDEIGDIPLETQVKLLRVLQEKQFDRVGGERTLTVDVRVVAATNQDLRRMVENRTFRRDLFYRLEVIPVRLPLLRERPADIRALVDHFMEQKCAQINVACKGLTEDAYAALEKYDWPGNVRELENVIERTVVLTERHEITAQDLPLGPGTAADAGVPTASSLDTALGHRPLNQILDTLEKELIEQAMEEANQVKTRAAEILQIKTSALYYKLDKYGLE